MAKTMAESNSAKDQVPTLVWPLRRSRLMPMAAGNECAVGHAHRQARFAALGLGPVDLRGIALYETRRRSPTLARQGSTAA